MNAPQPPYTPSPDVHAAATAPRSTIGTAIIRLGVVLFAAGVLSILISFAAPVFHAHLSNYFYFAAMLCPLGMIVCVIGALASGRSHVSADRSAPRRP